jgi:hypothetical protein
MMMMMKITSRQYSRAAQSGNIAGDMMIILPLIRRRPWAYNDGEHAQQRGRDRGARAGRA